MKIKNGQHRRLRYILGIALCLVSLLLMVYPQQWSSAPFSFLMGILLGTLLALTLLDIRRALHEEKAKRDENEAQELSYLEMQGEIEDFESLVAKRRDEIWKGK